MKTLLKLLQGIFLWIFFSSCATAETGPWTYIAGAKVGLNTIGVYLRLGTLKKDPSDKNHAEVWELYNNTTYQSRDLISYKSEVDLQNYDCASARAATLSQTLYDGEMGFGKALSNQSLHGFPVYNYPVPDTLEYAAMKAACFAIGHPI